MTVLIRPSPIGAHLSLELLELILLLLPVILDFLLRLVLGVSYSLRAVCNIISGLFQLYQWRFGGVTFSG